jgi:hypothetical protein
VYALHTSSPFIGEGPSPAILVGAAEKGVDVLGASGDGVVEFAGDDGFLLNGLSQVATMSSRVKMKTGEAGARAFSQGMNRLCRRWFRRSSGGRKHPRKWLMGLRHGNEVGKLWCSR